MKAWRNILVVVVVASLFLGVVPTAFGKTNSRAPMPNVNDSAQALYEYTKPDGSGVSINVIQSEKHIMDSEIALATGAPEISKKIMVLVIETDPNGNVFAETLAYLKPTTALSCCLDRHRIHAYGGAVRQRLVDGQWIDEFVILDVDLKLAGTGRVVTEHTTWTDTVTSTGSDWPMHSVTKTRRGGVSGYVKLNGATISGPGTADKKALLKTERRTSLPM